MRGFRAWHTKLGRYLKDDEFFVDSDGKVRTDSFGMSNYEEAFDTDDFDSGCIIREDDTGLKDKNGKEIYEGDIVDYNDDGECIGVVKYDAPEFYLDADATNWARMFLKGAPHQKVIGNIHENPELLEGEK